MRLVHQQIVNLEHDTKIFGCVREIVMKVLLSVSTINHSIKNALHLQ